ncbi:three-Cys-motif partner protein TcmP [Tepidibacillus decaturensis]|uniref:Three-Cys-motif partner protein TcmP n=1 Tax=Tepidibacillus decaturensis TaxID=1413211 RepID=A0A135L1E9_9BACI|nr:three-Cys-motif partner protein TcmP [Tepidibacillus decaturensis]KXG42851.1 hypothetical protein U473_01515 [Tepidibacillus decaturensis]
MAYGGKDNTIGEWSIDKLAFLEKYLPIFVNATKRALHRYYIDGFAGNGEWIHRETGEYVPGSATIALKYANDFTGLHFVEMDPDRVSNLKRLVKDFSTEHKAKVHQGDTNIILPEIMKGIHPKAPTFVFLDPSGDQLNWKTIESLANWKTELFILYPYHMTIARYLPNDKDELKDWQKGRLNNFFGTDEWYDIYTSNDRLYLLSELLNLYKSRLEKLGYSYCNVSEVFKNTTGQYLYYMIWVGKNAAGKKIMDWVYKQQNPQISLDI